MQTTLTRMQADLTRLQATNTRMQTAAIRMRHTFALRPVPAIGLSAGE